MENTLLEPGTQVVTRWEGYRGNPYIMGIQVADVARSYHLARMTGEASFQYDQYKNPFNGYVTDSNGNCGLDCSGFTALVIRGIDYEHSPFKGSTGAINKTIDPSIIATLCEESNYKWADKNLDRQTDPILKDTGVPGYRSVRNAAQIAQYYYDKGFTLYKYEKGASPTSIPEGLCPGDLVFWSKEAGNEEQKSRFMSITHVGIIGRDTTRFYQVTGSGDVKGDTVFYTELAGKLDEITLIVRPYYYPLSIPSSPLNVNLLPQYSFDDLAISPSKVENGVTFTALTSGGFTTKGKATTGTTFYLYAKEKPVRLLPGTYTLSGVPVHPQVVSGGTSTKWGLGIKDIDGNVIARNNGKSVTFTLAEAKEVYVFFYISADLTSTSTYTIKPSLERISY